MSQDRHDEVTDPWLAAALEDLRHEVPADVDWENLNQSINRRAQMVFARRRKSRSAARRPFVPLALAASVALALWSGPALIDRIWSDAPAATATADFDSEAILREALGGDLTDQEFNLLITGRANPEVLLAVAINSQ